MTFPLVRDLAAEGIPVVVTCEVLGFSPQAFYKWRANPVCDRDRDDAYLANAIIDIHADDPAFGYRFIADELEADGHQASENRVHRVCREHKIWSTTCRKGRKGSGKRPGPAVHDDLVKRVFTAERLDEVWLTDITEHPTSEGKVYCCAIKDVCSNRIVGYAIADRMTAQLATTALRTAIARRQPASTVVVHSDRRRIPVPVSSVPPCARRRQAPRLDGPSRLRWRQRRDGVVLLAPAEERHSTTVN